MLINGLKNIIKRNPIVFIGMIIYLFVVFLCLEFLFINIFDTHKYTDKTFQQVEDNQYRLVDMADTSTIVRDYYSVVNLKHFYNDLSHSENYTLYEGILQPTNITSFNGNEIFYDGYEYNQTNSEFMVDGHKYVSIKQILINYNKSLISDVGDNIIVGRSFTSDDFSANNYDEIPIIL